MMNRRDALLALVALGATSHAATAQGAGVARRIGYLDQGSAARDGPYVEAFRRRLRDLGWIEGQNIAIELRFAEGKTGRLPALAADLVRLKVDVLVTSTTPAALAAKEATATIPIVIGFAAGPVESGIVASLAHPGGNITGWTHQGLDLRAKYLELIKEALPAAVRIGVLWNPTNQLHKLSLKVIEAAAQKLGVELVLFGVQDPKEFEHAFSEFVAKRVHAVLVFPDGMFIAQTPLIVALAAHNRLPALYGVRGYARAGGLMTYGADLPDMYRLGASYVDKILRGARPADLPIEQPTKYELVINLKTADALGVAIPRTMLLRADEVIQ